MISTSSVPVTIMPSPPIWISPRITACPQPVQATAVSTVTRPVTVTALVAVKKASMKVARCSPGVMTGSNSSPVPTQMVAAKASATKAPGRSARMRLGRGRPLTLVDAASSRDRLRGTWAGYRPADPLTADRSLESGPVP